MHCHSALIEFFDREYSRTRILYQAGRTEFAALPELRPHSNAAANPVVFHDQLLSERCSGNLRPWSGLQTLHINSLRSFFNLLETEEGAFAGARADFAGFFPGSFIDKV